MSAQAPAPPLKARFVEIIRWLAILTPAAVVGGPSYADICATLVAFLFCIHAAWSRDLGWARQDWLYAAAALWLFSVLRSAVGEGGPDGVIRAATFIRFPLFAVALQSLVLAEKKWRDCLALSAAIALGVLACDAVFQYVTGRDVLGRPTLGFRLTAFYKHAWVGAMLSWTFLPPALALIDRGRRIWAAAFGALCITAILLSGDRMALLAALFALALLGLLFRQSRRVFLVAVPVGLLIAALFLTFNKTVYDRQVASTLETIGGFAHSHYAEIWGSAVRIWLSHPLFGVGSGGFRDVCPDLRYGPLYPFDPALPRCASHPHNLYLEWLADLGLVGLGLFLWMIVALGRRFIAGLRPGLRDWAYCGIFATFLARLWPLASWTSIHHAWSAVPFWLLVGWGLAYHARPPNAGSVP
jgi:O-antigen ligase